MKRDRKSVDERQNRILAMIRDNGEVKVEDLARTFGISLMTVRRDLQYLEERQLVNRFYGGASAVNRVHTMTAEEEVQMYRDLIGRYAARYVNAGDTLFINGSRTALNMLRNLEDKPVTVHTNNGWAVLEEYPKGVDVSVTGGKLRDRIMVGEYAMRYLLNLSADKTFLGCAAVYEDGEFRYDIPTEIGINEAMVSCTRGELFFLADHTKLQHRSDSINLYGSCTYEKPWTLITDEKANPDVVDRLRSSGMKVIQVEAEMKL
jgi:DeoR/GlpR family transcriptional regulator of sugar metabolism